MWSLVERGVPDGKMRIHGQNAVIHWPYGLAQKQKPRLCCNRHSDACESNRMRYRGEIDALPHRATQARVLRD